MAAIDNFLEQIASAVYGRDVRQAIVNAIRQCYTDANDPGCYIPTVTASGVLTWTATKDYLDPIEGSVNLMGPKPVKGTDYFTEADKQQLIAAVIAALPTAEGVSF